jgi:hypothetical protein
VIRATPSSPICEIMPCAVQKGPVVTIPVWAHLILSIPPIDCTRSNPKSENYREIPMSREDCERKMAGQTMYMSAGP